MELRDGEYLFTDDRERLRLDEVCRLLHQSHWARNRPAQVIAKTIESSLCFMIYHGDAQVGFARVLTDYAAYSLILDVIIDEKYRGKGLGQKLMAFIDIHPEIKATGKVLWTKYAAGLYRKCGFREEDCYTLMFKRS